MKALKIKFEIASIKPYELSSEQQEILNSQINLDRSHYKNLDCEFFLHGKLTN